MPGNLGPAIVAPWTAAQKAITSWEGPPISVVPVSMAALPELLRLTVLPFTVMPNRNVSAKPADTQVQYTPAMVCNQNQPPFIGSENVWKSISPWYKVVLAPPSVRTPPGSSDVADGSFTKRVKAKQNWGFVSWFWLMRACQK